ncbi:MAG TPA: TIGR03960 family B12-binding radical SAM protein [Clostridiaceae bacterium]|nr:TIGR03960 family B12-binding radical SAM protein [Clostridiaceae bacterium]
MSNVQLSHALLRSVEKPARYVGGEINSVYKDTGANPVRFGFCFPDTYEIGMSNMALRILYGILNARQDVWCERVFAPWVDMEKAMRSQGLPLFTIESRTPVGELDVLGFTLQYELSYSNVLNMLDLGNIPLYSSERKELFPLVCAGGPIAYCCEPIADFLDFVMVGDGEGLIDEVMDVIAAAKANPTTTKKDVLVELCGIQGIYVPSFYDVTYKEDGTIETIRPNHPAAPAKIVKHIVRDLDSVPFPTQMIVPNTEIVHDRMFLEVFRGCPRGCRFCQAGQLYRPVREKLPATLLRDAIAMTNSSGYDELGLLSLSTSDYSCLGPLTDDLLEHLASDRVSLSLPSLRLDSFSMELMERVSCGRRSGLTFAPEAGTQRLRDVINKGITEEDLLTAAATAFKGGYAGVKLYFMLGLPTETRAEVQGIADLAHKVAEVHRQTVPTHGKRRRLNMVVSTSMFIPKPFTPFQWAAQDTLKQMFEKQDLLKESIKTGGVRYNWHDAAVSRWEGVLARGDRRLAPVLVRGVQAGQTFDAWDECFDSNIWLEAMAAEGLDPDFYTTRTRSKDEFFPWDHIDCGVTRQFLWREWEKAQRAELTQECRTACHACGAQRFNCGICPTAEIYGDSSRRDQLSKGEVDDV